MRTLMCSTQHEAPRRPVGTRPVDGPAISKDRTFKFRLFEFKLASSHGDGRSHPSGHGALEDGRTLIGTGDLPVRAVTRSFPRTNLGAY
jgi:hypothetical protein